MAKPPADPPPFDPPAAGPPGPPAADATAPTDDVKAKFRAALDRKKHQRAAGQPDGEGGDGTRIHATHEAAATQRTFRRKSG